MKILITVPFLLLAACDAQEPDSRSETTADVADAGWEKLPPGESETPTALADAELPDIGQGPRAPKIVQSYKPAREPQFHFETDAVSDVQLSEFYLEMDIQIDAETIGTMTFVLWGDLAPITVRNYLRYADEGFYDGKVFHRILRDFMVQGGSSNNTASGQGPHPMIKAEFSRDPARRHRYGVLSMARGGGRPDSASSQFFLIAESNSPSTHGLDGQYASFGILHQGVAVLERLADIKTVKNPFGGEQSQPTQRAVITELRVLRGTPSVATEKIERPPIDLHGEPERVRIQHVLISFAGTGTAATRSKEEAQALAAEVLKRARSGEDFGALVMEFSDDPGGKSSHPPGMYSMLNKGQHPPTLTPEQIKEQEELNQQVQALQTDLLQQVQDKKKTLDEAREEFMASEPMQKLQLYSWALRDQMVAAFGNVGFSLEIGEIGMSEFDSVSSPFGWHIILRFE